MSFTFQVASGLSLDLLQEFYLISLDIFQKSSYAKDNNELNGWLTTENAGQVEGVIDRSPWLVDIYREINSYLHNPKEVPGAWLSCPQGEFVFRERYNERRMSDMQSTPGVSGDRCGNGVCHMSQKGEK